jgi:hypothetical protein
VCASVGIGIQLLEKFKQKFNVSSEGPLLWGLSKCRHLKCQSSACTLIIIIMVYYMAFQNSLF